MKISIPRTPQLNHIRVLHAQQGVDEESCSDSGPDLPLVQYEHAVQQAGSLHRMPSLDQKLQGWFP